MVGAAEGAPTRKVRCASGERDGVPRARHRGEVGRAPVDGGGDGRTDESLLFFRDVGRGAVFQSRDAARPRGGPGERTWRRGTPRRGRSRSRRPRGTLGARGPACRGWTVGVRSRIGKVTHEDAAERRWIFRTATNPSHRAAATYPGRRGGVEEGDDAPRARHAIRHLSRVRSTCDAGVSRSVLRHARTRTFQRRKRRTLT